MVVMDRLERRLRDLIGGLAEDWVGGAFQLVY